MTDLIIKKVTSENVDLRALIEMLDQELLTKYPKEGIFGLDFNDPEIKQVTFAVAYLSDIAVGCGGIKPLDNGVMELKRFFIDSRYRRKGIASKLLAYLEGEAVSHGARLVKLETGPKQPDAIGLYKKNGYYEIELYGEYCDSNYSTCFEKILVE